MTSTALRSFSVVVAATAHTMGIGKRGDLPWRIPEDMQFFKHITTSLPLGATDEGKMNAVIMGRKTWESIPNKFRPLRQRLNVVLSRDPKAAETLALPPDVLLAQSLEEALTKLNAPTIENVFVIGGGAVYEQAVKLPQCNKIYLTEILTEMEESEFDTFFPTLSASRFRLTKRSRILSDANHSYRFTEYDSIDENELFGDKASSSVGSTINADKKGGSVPLSPDSVTDVVVDGIQNFEEAQYLDIVRDIITNGIKRGDRTGTGTLSKFGVQMRFNLRDGRFPLLTTKKVFWRGVAEELLWFVAGHTNGNLLRDKNIHIWDGNGSREFLDSRGLQHREEMDLGPVYGFQWRHFGAEYSDMHADYTGQGVDQLMDCIRKIKTSPEDRRIIMTAWNPKDLDKMALPPCHMFCQFYVADGELSCQMYQRSADMGLGVPFNIASYSLLTCMMAQVCGLKTGDFVHSIGDAHVYSNHVDALKEQLLRTPRVFPTLKINPSVREIDQFKFSDFTIEGYEPYAPIKMKMAV